MKKELKEKLGEDYSISTKNGTLSSYQAKMREKKLLLSMIILFLTISGCRKQNEEWKRNPNLSLLLKEEGKNSFHPVWSPANKVYYLYQSASYPLDALHFSKGGHLWVIDINSKEKRHLLDGPFCALAVSFDGSKLALSYEIDEDEFYLDGGPLLLVDTAGILLDTLPTKLPRILDVEFNSTGTKLFYYAYSLDTTQSDSFGFYSINIDGTDEELVQVEKNWIKMRLKGFDINSRDSIIYQQYVFPQVNPVKSHYILFGGGPTGPSKLKLKNILDGSTIILDAHPYASPEDNNTIFHSGYWSPSGDKIVISAANWEGGLPAEGVEALELWILNKVW